MTDVTMADDPRAAQGGAPLFFVHFAVKGEEPIPQGSMKLMPITRVPPQGLVIRSVKELLSKVAMTSDNTKLKPWRMAVANAALDEMSAFDLTPLEDCAVKVQALFTFPYLKSHFKSDGETLKASRPFFKQSRPDTDKLQRALGDGMTGIVFKDDAQVAWWDVKRIYGSTPGVSVYVYSL